MIRVFTVVSAVLLAAVVVASPSSACACGIAFHATVPAQRALIVSRDGREQLVVSFDVLSSGRHAAVVLPVPATPTVAPARPGVFQYLEAATAPPVPVGSAPSGGDKAPAGAAPGVHVISNERIGGYQVATLGADSDVGALSDWLVAHYYRLPDGAEPIIASYLRRGWSFVAVRLAKQADGALDPLDIRFASKHAIYPMRLEQLGTEPVTVDLWVVGDRAVSVPPLHETYSGAVAKLDPTVPRQFKRYLDGQWITRTEGNDLEPSTLTRDFVALPVASSVTAQSTSRLAVHFGDTTEPKWWVWLLLGFGLTALVAFIVVMVKRA